ncbi:MAG TPA: hypothetical protein VMF06_03705 [Candidatus Limnocylindria bacterium]|jgi:hypothetical protein|nr:hypothetical protein [Candidatus Limnocylindria bacterium]
MTTVSRTARASLGFGLLLAAALAGCKRDEVQTYQAPKDVAPPAPPVAAVATPEPTSGDSDIEHAPGTPWKVPTGWQPKAASGPRIASYSVTTPDNRAVDISVVALKGESGTELDNINRWRGQAQLDPITEAEIPAARNAVPIGNRIGTLYEFAGDKPTIDGKYKPGMLVGVLPAGEITIFFKMVGELELVKAEKPHFLEWLKSVQTEAGPSTASESPAPSTAPTTAAAGTPPDMRGNVAQPPRTDLPNWEPPSHWKLSGPRPMRLASFEVPNATGPTPGDLSITALAGDAGGLLANVNRWRGQVNLGAADEETLAKESEKVELPGGSGTLVDLKGGQKRILAITVPRGDKTWFYKLTGDDQLVSKEREGFIKFVKSVKY